MWEKEEQNLLSDFESSTWFTDYQKLIIHDVSIDLKNIFMTNLNIEHKFIDFDEL